MAENLGSGVSRTLDPKKTGYQTVVWQQGRPPTDAELNLMQQLATEWDKIAVSSGTPSGWLGNGLNDHESFVTDPSWSNWFRFGNQRTGEASSIQWAVVNGWLVPVAGTRTGSPPGSPDDVATWNRVTLDPPPSNSGDSRVDFVFLEVWQALLPPNPSSTNKPSANGIWKYGNVEGGASFLSDDMKDPALGVETTKRVQLQYRIRVVSGLVGLTSYPDGFDPANVRGRGAAASDTAFPFMNMRGELGDPGLWRAGDGTPNSLGTVDGYTYAIPLAAVFRRNSVAWDGDPGQNLNGGFNRNPTAVDRTGWRTFSTVPTLSAHMTESQTTLSLASATNIPLPTSPASDVFIQVGDEIMSYSAITGTTLTITGRGLLGTRAEAHRAGDAVKPLPGRPDGLYSDQIAKTDILDLRHVVTKGGFDYNSLLRTNLDKLLKGQLRANWKRSGAAGPQGTMVHYQDKVSASAAALGVAKLDSPDGVRQVWSDASVLQPVEFIASAPGSTGPSVNITTTWGLEGPLTGTASVTSVNQFSTGDKITIPIAPFKGTVGSDADQVCFPKLDNTAHNWVTIRRADSETPLDPNTDFSVDIPTDSNSNLVITMGTTVAAGVPLFITLHVQYGPGRGLSRRPDCVHGVDFTNAVATTVLRQKQTAANNIPTSVAWAPLCSKFRRSTLNGMIPVTAESYVDPGSKTLLLTPFRQVPLPSVAIRPLKDDALHGVGLMPNVGNKWGATTDPLGLFSGHTDNDPARSNTYVVLPRHLMPGWGAVYAPIRHTTSGVIYEGINFGFNAPTGSVPALESFVPHNTSAGVDTKSFFTFTTVNLATLGTTITPATYNELSGSDQGATPAGIRFFEDFRGLGRRGLQLPPFYGIARLFAVYEAADFHILGSAYDPSTRERTGTGAVNLLRQDFEGPAFWIEIDQDGDSTFVLNAEAIDISKSPNAIASFEAGHYVVEASIFGFDRGAFDLSQPCRIVLSRTRPATGPNGEVPTTNVSLIIPAPPQGADSIVVNYSRTPYQGDAWHSQSLGSDSAQLVGPRTSADAHRIATTELDASNLSRPNQKALEVLASVGFATTLGTGRLSGDFDMASPLDLRNPGYEDGSAYPPALSSSTRPELLFGGALGSDDTRIALGTEVTGATTRLPLGSLFRDKDFRGEVLDGASPLIIKDVSPGVEATGISSASSELHSAPVFTAAASGIGDTLVHVDGETDNLINLTNFRTTRGGSVFVASGLRPGGEISAILGSLPSSTSFNAALAGVAYLVRSSVTSVGAAEVSAGGELMMLICTTVARKDSSEDVPLRVLVGTNGSGEGWSAADLYRIEGHPLVAGSTTSINPSSIQLSPKVSLK